MTKTIQCGNVTTSLVQGMVIASVDKVGDCVWIMQIEGTDIHPTAIAASSVNVWVTGSFSNTMAFAADNTATAQGAEDAFVLRLSTGTGDIVAKKTYGGEGAIARGNSITIGQGVGTVDETAYVGGYLRGKTGFSDQLGETQTAAFVASFDTNADLVSRVVYPGTTAIGEETYGTSVRFVNGNLYLAGTISGQASIDGSSTNIQGIGNNAFLAKIDSNTNTTKWFRVFAGGGESFVTKSFFLTIQGLAPIVAASWVEPLTFPGEAPLDPKGLGDDIDIAVAKLSF